MITDYLTDTINIITYTYDKWGAVTGSITQSGVKARIEDVNKIVRDENGKEVAGQGPITIDPSATVSYKSKIQLVTRNGQSTGIQTKEFAIKSIENAHGFDESHFEVYI